jgi:YVTN family beta-propeller protein
MVPGNVPVTVPINQSVGAGATTNGNFFDNTKGNLVRHQLGHIRPLALGAGGTLLAPNNAGQRLSILLASTGALLGEIPTGPGITAVLPRPGSSEVWAVDSVNGCVSVIDPGTLRIVRTIQVGKEPHGIVFTANGSRAYVTCSAANRVDVIDCANYTVQKNIPIPAIGPRGIAITAAATNTPEIVWVAPIYSGNNTVSKLTAPPQPPPLTPPFAGAQSVVVPNPALGEIPLPDQDLFAIPVTASATSDALDPSRTRTGLGTILLNLHARPGTTELWIPNTDARNLTIGEANFVGGKVVSNRITIVNTATSVGTLPIVLDLDLMAPAGAAQPAAVAFDAPRNRAYVAAFGSDVVLVLNTGAAGYPVIGRHTLRARTPSLPVAPNTAARCGPRGLQLSANGNELFVYHGIDNSWTRINLAVLNSAAPLASTLGFDPTPAEVKRGLGHLANADHSPSKTSSCMSCHVDGHFDMLTWNLAAFRDPANTSNPQFEIDDKGPMATQSLRGLFESGRLHWRGEQVGLDDFNVDGFQVLLHRSTPLTAAEFEDVRAGTNSLVYPANPRAPNDRVYSGALGTGLDAFRRTTAVGPDTCASCHSLPLGTNTELQVFAASGIPAHSGKVAQLRGVGDKVSQSVPVFTDPAYLVRVSAGSTILDRRSCNGWGLTHGATVDSIATFVATFPGIFFADLVPEVSAFVDAFDTGLAPSTTWQRTLVPVVHTLAEWQAALAAFKAQAQAGNCDVVVATAVLVGGLPTPVTLCWDHALQRWQTAAGWASFDDAMMDAFLFGAGFTVTLFGQPLGTGRRFGVDRDLDDLLDDDEANFTPFLPSHRTDPDTDRDGFPDGHEAKHAPTMNPRALNTTSPDVTAPQFTSPAGSVVTWVTASSAKLEFTTDEPTTAAIDLDLEATTSPTSGKFDRNHVILLRDLQSNTTFSFSIKIIDVKGNANSLAVSLTTMPTGDGLRVVSIQAAPFVASNLTVTVAIGSLQNPTSTAGAGHSVFAYAYADANTVPLTQIAASLAPVTAGPTKQATFTVAVPANVLAAPAGTRRLHFGVRNVIPPFPLPAGALPYIEANDVISHRVITF